MTIRPLNSLGCCVQTSPKQNSDLYFMTYKKMKTVSYCSYHHILHKIQPYWILFSGLFNDSSFPVRWWAMVRSAWTQRWEFQRRILLFDLQPEHGKLKVTLLPELCCDFQSLNVAKLLTFRFVLVDFSQLRAKNNVDFWFEIEHAKEKRRKKTWWKKSHTIVRIKLYENKIEILQE